MSALQSRYEGFVSVRVIEPAQQDRSASALLSGEEADCDWGDGLYGVVFRFDTLPHLQAWVVSSEREAMMLKLRPFIDAAEPSGGRAPDGQPLQQRRSHRIPDSFTDLLVPQGQAAPSRPPPKWKVTFLTTLALFLVVWALAKTMPRHYERWGIVPGSAGFYLADTAFSTFVNSYAAAPFITLTFGHWLREPRPVSLQQPWKSLDAGLSSTRSQVGVVLAFFGGCLLRWLLERGALPEPKAAVGAFVVLAANATNSTLAAEGAKGL